MSKIKKIVYPTNSSYQEGQNEDFLYATPKNLFKDLNSFKEILRVQVNLNMR